MNPNKVTSANDLNGRVVLLRLRTPDPGDESNQMICHVSEVNAQGIMVITGPKHSVSRFIPWWNVEYVQADAAIMDEEGVSTVEVSGFVQ